ncbi:MAG: hypothetical protein AB7V77_04915 [Candidatus Woesearchaeota archaeon]
MVTTDEIIKTLVQSTIIKKIVESELDKKVSKEIEKKLSSLDYNSKNAMKKIFLELLDDYSVKEKIKKIR